MGHHENNMTTAFTDKFKAFLSEQCRIAPGQVCLLAVSGGLDSMCMAQLFAEAGIPMRLAHCNFGLRGADSDADEQFVLDWAANRGIAAFSKRFDTADVAAVRGVSTQVAARDLRYAWFAELAREQGCSVVATAHHLNDAAETALFNWSRGTGLDGLKGIQARTADARLGEQTTLVRPLLFATRPEIEAYAAEADIRWRTDSSNATDKYSRNFVRHHIVPLFEELNPNFVQTAARNQRRVQGTLDNYIFLLTSQLGLGKRPPYRIFTEKLRDLPDPVQALSAFIRPWGFTEEEARQAASLLDDDTLRLDITSSQGWRLLTERAAVVLTAPDAATGLSVDIFPDDMMVKIPGGGSLFLLQAEYPGTFPIDPNEVYVPAHALVFPLRLRHWQPGDAFQPFGMQGKSQKLQDYFTNLKLTKLEKEAALVLENGNGEIIWLVGLRLDERYRIGAIEPIGSIVRLIRLFD
jgi:tRNA(Ile)-lysidine synthase